MRGKQGVTVHAENGKKSKAFALNVGGTAGMARPCVDGSFCFFITVRKIKRHTYKEKTHERKVTSDIQGR